MLQQSERIWNWKKIAAMERTENNGIENERVSSQEEKIDSYQHIAQDGLTPAQEDDML